MTGIEGSLNAPRPTLDGARELTPNSARRRVLLGWELGAGRGHLEVLATVAARLVYKDYELVFAARDVRAAAEVLKQHGLAGIAIRQAPIFLHRARALAGGPSSMAEVLANVGFASPELLRPVVAAWRRLLEEVEPDVIVAETAPSLILANKGARPLVAIGNGWTMPPDRSPPPLLPGRRDATRALIADEAIVAAVESAAGVTLATSSSMIRGAKSFVCTPPMLDPYAAERDEETWWPPDLHNACPKKGVSRRGIVVYLPARHSRIESLVGSLLALELPARCYFGGRTSPVRGDKVSVEEEPIDLEATLPSAELIVHHGGLGTSSRALIHGTRQLVLPFDGEKLAIAEAVTRMGAGRALLPGQGSLTPALQHALRTTPSPPLSEGAFLARSALGEIVAAATSSS